MAMQTGTIDPATLTEQEIRAAIIYHGFKLGSDGSYVDDEIRRGKDRARLTVFRDHITDRLRAYTDGKG